MGNATDVFTYLLCIQVLANDNPAFGYNAATGVYEDLMAAGIIDPAKVVRCCLEHAASVAKIFLTSDVVVTEIKEPEGAAPANPMDASGKVKTASVVPTLYTLEMKSTMRCAFCTWEPRSKDA